MEVKTVKQYSEISGLSVENIRQSINVHKERLPAFVFYNGEYHETEQDILVVIYGDGSPETIREKYNKARAERKRLDPSPKGTKGYNKEYRKKYILSKPEVKIAICARSLIYNSFRRACKGKYRKSKKSESILGIPMNEFLLHLQRQFSDGMSFENYGKWHIDHKKPLKLAKTEAEIYELCHYSNLQPLWAIDNIKKGSKYEQ